MPLQEIVTGIEARAKTGILKVAQGNITKTFYFNNGAIIFVNSSQPGERIGEFLSGIGCIDLQRLQDLLEESRRQGVHFSADLIAEKVFERNSLETALTQLILIALADALKWREGSFELSAHLPDSVLHSPVPIRVENAQEKSTRFAA
ncbi:MAG: DUF4388 domain-containing protein, partial [Desulfuromonadaceae bacterium]